MPVYDQGHSKIGFYDVMIKSKNSYRAIAIVGFIFFIICSAVLVYLSLYLYRKYKNKKIRQAAMEMRIEEISSKLVEKQAENKDINN
jgi:sensor histidine kinase regulating citrate/malate metabolism